MCAVLREGGLKLRQKLLGHFGRVTAHSHEREQLLLPGDVPFALGDMVVHHLEVGGGEGHASEYHLRAAKSSLLLGNRGRSSRRELDHQLLDCGVDLGRIGLVGVDRRARLAVPDGLLRLRIERIER